MALSVSSYMSSTIATDIDNEDTQNVTIRTRSRKKSHGDEFTDSLSEIRKMITDLKLDQNNKLDALQASINDIRKQNEGIIDSVEHLSNEYKDLKKQFECLKKEKRSNMEYMRSLETKIETLEMAQKHSSVEIKNIPPKSGETKEDLLTLINKLGKTLNLPIQKSDIRDIFRISTKTTENKPIIVDFASVIMKENIMEHCKMFNNQHKENRLNTSHLQIEGSQKNIYFSENLTSKSRRLFFLARDFAKTNDYKYCWTAGGKIFIRKKQGELSVRINGEEDINKLKADLKI